MTSPRRRARGEGSIYRQKTGLWAATIDLGGSGPRRRRTVYGKTRTEVRSKLTALARDRDRGLLPRAGPITTAQYLEYWLEQVARPRLRRSTFERYTRAVQRDLIPGLGHIKLEELRPADLRKLMAEGIAKGFAAGTVNYLRSVLRVALADAVRDELLSRNIAALCSPARGPAQEYEPFTEQEARAFLDAVEPRPPLCALAGLSLAGPAPRRGGGPAMGGRRPGPASARGAAVDSVREP